MGSTINNLPEEILLYIFTRFSIFDSEINNIKLVCHKWNNIALDSTLAREIIIRPIYFKKGSQKNRISLERIIMQYGIGVEKLDITDTTNSIPITLMTNLVNNCVRLKYFRFDNLDTESQDASSIIYLLKAIQDNKLSSLNYLAIEGYVIACFGTELVNALCNNKTIRGLKLEQPMSISDTGILLEIVNKIVRENQTITDLAIVSIVDYTPMATQFISALRANKTIKRLTITFKFTYPNIVSEFANFLKNNTLEFLQILLNVSSNTGKTAIEPFCSVLTTLTNLKTLKFWDMMFPAADIALLQNCLLQNQSLKELHFENCKMNDEVLKSLLTTLTHTNIKLMSHDRYAFNIAALKMQNENINNLKLSDYEAKSRK